MPHDDLPRRALIADLSRRLALLSFRRLRILDRAAAALERFDEDRDDIDDLTIALHEAGKEMDAEDRAVAEAREVARDAMVARGDVQIGLPGDNVSLDPLEFAVDQHLTRVSEVPARLAAAELERRPAERWPDYESVDLRFDDSELLDASDAEEPLEVHAPGGGELGGEGGE